MTRDDVSIGEGSRSHEAALRRTRRLALRLALVLAVLTAIEFVIAVNIEDALIWLLPFIAAKGWLILVFFMHIRVVLQQGAR